MDRGLPKPGDIIAEKYLVTGLIGRGGMGAVYVVEHRLTAKKLAVKCLLPEHSEHPELVERFLREASAAGRIQHRNVVDVFDVGRDGELLYIVMELLEGKALSDLLRDSALPLGEALLILMRAMEGVAAAHAHGIVHRDLKPENIMVCTGQSGKLDDPRVLDFGISKLEEDAARPLTKSGVMMGTPYYMSFEQIASQRDLDQRVDVYAMGVIVYEAMSGRVPYSAESVGALAVQMMSGPPMPLAELRPDLPPGLTQVVMRSIAKERDARYPTMQALIDALRPFVETEPFAGTPTARTSLSGSTPPRSLRLTGEAPTVRANTPYPSANDTPLRVFEDDEISQRPGKSSAQAGGHVGKLALAGGGAVLLGALAFALWPRAESAPVPRVETPAAAGSKQPAAAGASPELPPAARPDAPGVGQQAAVAEPPAALADASVDAELPAPEEEAEPSTGKRGAKKKKKPGRVLTDDMVPAAPPLPESEREAPRAAEPAPEAPKEPAPVEPAPPPPPAAEPPATP